MAGRMLCPCGSGLEHEACCGPVITRARPAATAEALMRSRYSAYAVGAVDHLAATHHPRTVATFDRGAAAGWARSARWDGLEIVATEGGGPDDDAGVVEFIARYTQDGAAVAHRERSRFERHGGRWHYVDGDIIGGRTVVRDAPKVGRNDPCPCGSGKKSKKCCGAG
jgi:SEC-C motif-containing protein